MTLRVSDAPFPADGSASATLVAGDGIFPAKVSKDGRKVQVGHRVYALAKPLSRRDLKVFAPRPFGKRNASPGDPIGPTTFADPTP